MIIYSKSSGTNNAAIGKLETPIKMVIEHESDLQTKKGGACDWLFNIERSHRFGETIVGQNEFDIFQATAEGEGAVPDTLREIYHKFIEHVQFTKEFSITAEMMEDANFGVAADAKRRAENFTRSYYKTIHRLCTVALTSATEATADFAGATLDLTTGDGLPMFSNKHVTVTTELEMPNYFYGNFMHPGTDTKVYSIEKLDETLSYFATLMRMGRDEHGSALGYTADTIVLPANRVTLERMVKRLCGSIYVPGSSDNDINLQYHNWNVVILPDWFSNDDRFILMSSEANKELCGNMFFNRVPLTVSSWVDHHTGNYNWSGRCRFGVGFGTYKHAIMVVNSMTAIENADRIDL